MGLAGKTIARVADLDYDGQALIFTDGTAAHFQGTGYDTDGCRVGDVSEMDVLYMEAELEDRRRSDAVIRERNIARRAERDAAKARLSPEEYRVWLSEHYSPMELLFEGYMDSMRFDMNRQAFGGSSVPFAKVRNA